MMTIAHDNLFLSAVRMDSMKTFLVQPKVEETLKIKNGYPSLAEIDLRNNNFAVTFDLSSMETVLVFFQNTSEHNVASPTLENLCGR
ncbi:hypothetical protein FQR65_LT05724 [Abscondita terminalis]|nr:hypothetical protein FQR65_LT05724 [Abscondita terminalis]